MTLTLRPRPVGVTLLRWLCDEIRSAIVEGRLLPGAKLPSTRSIARQYSVARGTVVAAFDDLTAEGYIEGVVGSGSFVRDAAGLVARAAVATGDQPRAAVVSPLPSVQDPRWVSNPALLECLRLPRNAELHPPEQPAAIDLKLGSIGQICRSVRDIRESESWYRETLGLQHLHTSGNLALFDCGGTRLLLTQADEPSVAESLLYFRVSHVERAHDELKRRGVEFINAPQLIHRHSNGTEEWMALFNDPDGRPLAIMSQVKSVS